MEHHYIPEIWKEHIGMEFCLDVVCVSLLVGAVVRGVNL